MVRSKAKSGCRTCKIRRVKCDEVRPSCRRCMSTGRTCDGYGIWGDATHSLVTRICLSAQMKPSTLPISYSAEEHDCFVWFKYRTVTKIPGVFGSTFWDTIVFQAIYSEPAVLHAILALGSAHKRGIDYLDSDKPVLPSTTPDEQEQFLLRQYSLAISSLQPHFTANDKASIRVALITCLIFVCLEFLRGHYGTGNVHLRNGIKLLSASGMLPDGIQDFRDPVDRWLIETFSRLNIQALLFGQGYLCTTTFPLALELGPSPITFETMSEARTRWDMLLSEIFHLNEQCRREGADCASDKLFPHLVASQRRIQASLSSWFRAFRASRVKMQSPMGLLGPAAFMILGNHARMAKIMLDACIRPRGEASFDAHTEDFFFIVTRSIRLSKFIKSSDFSDTVFQYHKDVSAFVADIGWLSPLYYTAIKCRVHRLRLQAIKLISSTPNKEGVWDGRLASAMAREVMRLEERGYYAKWSSQDDFLAYSEPEKGDLELPPFPESQMIREVQVHLPNTPSERAILTCAWRRSNGGLKVLEREYDPLTRSWRDKDMKAD